MSAPRFNHVALSLPASALDEAGCAELLAFYREVFEWEEMPTMTKPGQQLVLQAHRYDQFVFLVADDQPMTCPRMDHFGLAVGSADELQVVHDRAQRYAARDDRVDLIGITVEDYGFLRLHSFYVGYLLPMMVEVQYWDWTEGGPRQADVVVVTPEDA
jgi:hypothetical protein